MRALKCPRNERCGAGPEHQGVGYTNDFGHFGAAFVETGVDEADRATIIENLLSGQYSNPVAVVAFNVAEGWDHDVSTEVCREVMERAAGADHDLGEQTMKFIEHHCGTAAAE
jgi:hypothetical protein